MKRDRLLPALFLAGAVTLPSAVDARTGPAPGDPAGLRQATARATAGACADCRLGAFDHLGDVTVPVLYVGAAGSFGESGVHTTTLLGSSDVTVHLIQMQPPELAVLDFGHSDLFQADDAETLVWEPILAWLITH